MSDQERGDFHPFCYRPPEFSTVIYVTVGEIIERGGFWLTDLGCSPVVEPPLGQPARRKNP
jgi:hypothetical protein